MAVTVTLSETTAQHVADLIRHDLSLPRRESVLNLRHDDDADAREELRDLARLLDH